MQDYKEYFYLPAPPEQVYLALTTETTIQLWTGEEAIMVPEAATEFSLWGGAITGKNLSFEKNRQIEQQWYFGDEPEKSIVRIKLHEQKQGTSLEVRQSNIPDEAYEDMVDGWRHTYIASLLEFYQE